MSYNTFNHNSFISSNLFARREEYVLKVILISKWFSAIIQKQFCPSITATKIWFFEKPKTKSVLVYQKA